MYLSYFIFWVILNTKNMFHSLAYLSEWLYKIIEERNILHFYWIILILNKKSFFQNVSLYKYNLHIFINRSLLNFISKWCSCSWYWFHSQLYELSGLFFLLTVPRKLNTCVAKFRRFLMPSPKTGNRGPWDQNWSMCMRLTGKRMFFTINCS